MYGQTETGFPITYLSTAEHFLDGDIAAGRLAPARRLGSCGRVTPLARIAIMDDDGRLLEDGEIGEIAVQSSGTAPGYYRDPEATAAVRREGWHLTGDIGVRDAEGYISIVDRKRDMIISGGFNVYSAEVERTIGSHPQVTMCAVIGTPDPKWGEAVTAVIERVPGGTVTADEIMTLCREQLGSVKTPKRVDFVDALPRTPVGKVLKREVRAPYWAGHTRHVN
jgi:acyl-CoA synthetase (AMP-forming)/AMP-acid ligase II